MRILITGFAGFVSRHFLNLLSEKKENFFVFGLDRNEILFDVAAYRNIKIETFKTDLRDKNTILKILQTYSPDYILHLASASSVQYSWQHPSEVFINNNTIFLSILDAVKAYNKNIRILSIGTADVYGKAAAINSPVHEDASLFPSSPYAASKASIETIAKIYAESLNIDIMLTRSFTHFGAYQKDTFVLAKFAKQLTLIKKNKQAPVLTVGNIDLIRDLSDVRDVVNAYDVLFDKGKTGEIYNVCSGTGKTLRSALEIMMHQLQVDVELKTDESLLRKGDIECITGSNEKIKHDTGWQPKITFEQSIADLLDFWDKQV